MSCCNNGYLSVNSLEFKRRYKLENSSACCQHGPNTCSTPSLAEVDSPLWKWEQIYGKLVTTVRFEQNEFGRTVQIVEKIPCGIEIKRKKDRCCSFVYKNLNF